MSIIEGYLEQNGGKLFYKSIGEGSPILCIHGGPGLTHDYFLPYLLELVNSNNKLIFLDQRGNGLSSYLINDEFININQFTLDIEALRKALDIDKMIVLGHSMGTFFAIDYAKKFPQHVSKLILSNATPMDLENLMKMNDNLNDRVSKCSMELSNIVNSLEFRNNDSEALKNYLTEINKKSFVNEYLANELFKDANITKEFMGNFKSINKMILTEYIDRIESYDLTDIIAQTLIINSDYDFIPTESSKYIAERIPQSRIEYIYDSGHYPFIEKTEVFISKIINFLYE